MAPVADGVLLVDAAATDVVGATAVVDVAPDGSGVEVLVRGITAARGQPDEGGGEDGETSAEHVHAQRP